MINDCKLEITKCYKCYGCNKLEDMNFTGVKECEVYRNGEESRQLHIDERTNGKLSKGS